MSAAVAFTVFFLAWAAWWGAMHRRIRRNRAYAQHRSATSTDSVYRWTNPFLYVMQIVLCTTSFWSASPWLLAFHHSDIVRAIGIALLYGASALYAWAIAHLGSNYSPCYDTHAPADLVRTGPYRWIRHPMYAAKLVLGAATIVTSGSLWFVPTTIYFFAATLQATWREDRTLAESLPEYRTYQSRTSLLVPWIGITGLRG